MKSKAPRDAKSHWLARTTAEAIAGDLDPIAILLTE
jgi:hypothetical protein